MEDIWKLQEQKFDEQYESYLASGGTKTREEWFSEQAHSFAETFRGMNDLDPTDENPENLNKSSNNH